MDIDPFFKLEWVDMPGSFALAALDENVEKKELNKAGLIVCSCKEDMFIIEWIYVAPEYRCQGIAENLLSLVFEYAIKKGKSFVGARFLEYENDNSMLRSRAFFEERLFYSKKELPGEWMIDLETLSKNAVEDGNSSDYEIMPLRMLSEDEQEKLMENLDSAKIPSLYSIKGHENTLEADVSVVLKRRDKIVGTLFVKAVSTSLNDLQQNSVDKIYTLYPVLFYIQSPKMALYLIEEAIRRAAARFPKDTVVRFVLREIDASDLINRFCPEGKIDTTLLIASTSDYEIWKSYRAYAE